MYTGINEKIKISLLKRKNPVDQLYCFSYEKELSYLGNRMCIDAMFHNSLSFWLCDEKQIQQYGSL